jgi:hypothetical protein
MPWMSEFCSCESPQVKSAGTWVVSQNGLKQPFLKEELSTVMEPR